jgi:hypothetical protein
MTLIPFVPTSDLSQTTEPITRGTVTLTDVEKRREGLWRKKNRHAAE